MEEYIQKLKEHLSGKEFDYDIIESGNGQVIFATITKSGWEMGMYKVTNKENLEVVEELILPLYDNFNHTLLSVACEFAKSYARVKD